MKVQRGNDEPMTFDKLSPGDCFEVDLGVFIKGCGKGISINVNDGQLVEFDAFENVKPYPNAKIVLN